MLHVIAIAALVSYFASSALYIVRLLARLSDFVWPRRLFHLGILLHTLSMVPFLYDERLWVLQNAGDYFYCVSWLIPLFYLVIGRKLDFPIVACFVSTATCVFMVSSSYLLHYANRAADRPPHRHQLLLIGMHAVPALLAEVCLALSMIVSIVFLLLNRRLKRKAVDALSLGGPSLESLDRLNYRFVAAGFVLMTLAVLSGIVWALITGRPLFVPDPATTSAFLAWIVLAALLEMRITSSISPRRFSALSAIFSAAFFVVLVSLLFLAGEIHAA
jgi:ABC-type transport system involved in cytochrome c biogenesis permease subunit